MLLGVFMKLTFEGLDNILVRLGIALCSPTMAVQMLDAINSKLEVVPAPLAGLWTARPTTGLVNGLMYFATDEKIPYFYNTSDLTWYDATGVAHL
jgi:hypothetical protein